MLRSENVRAYMYMYLENSKMYYMYAARTQLCGKMHKTEHYPNVSFSPASREENTFGTYKENIEQHLAKSIIAF